MTLFIQGVLGENAEPKGQRVLSPPGGRPGHSPQLRGLPSFPLLACSDPQHLVPGLWSQCPQGTATSYSAPHPLDAIVLLPKALQGLPTAIAQGPSPAQRPWASLHTLLGPTSPARFPSLQALLTALLPQTLSAYSHLPPPHLLAPTTWAFPPQLPVSILDFGLVPLHHISQYPSCSPRDAWPPTALCCPLLAASGLAGCAVGSANPLCRGQVSNLGSRQSLSSAL